MITAATIIAGFNLVRWYVGRVVGVAVVFDKFLSSLSWESGIVVVEDDDIVEVVVDIDFGGNVDVVFTIDFFLVSKNAVAIKIIGEHNRM